MSGCGVNGDNYPNGARVPAGDLCQDCTCVVRHGKDFNVSSVLKDDVCFENSSLLLQNGNVLCSAHPCPSPPCQNPVRRPGDCCPRWPPCLYILKPIPQLPYYLTISVIIKKSERVTLAYLPTGVHSVNTSPNCTWMDRSSPPGRTRAFTAAALWVHAAKLSLTQCSLMPMWLDATQLY